MKLFCKIKKWRYNRLCKKRAKKQKQKDFIKNIEILFKVGDDVFKHRIYDLYTLDKKEDLTKLIDKINNDPDLTLEQKSRMIFETNIFRITMLLDEIRKNSAGYKSAVRLIKTTEAQEKTRGLRRQR